MDALLYQLLQLFIVKNNIQLHKEELKLQLLSHPSYPSLHSVTGVLEHFGVPNVALKVPSTLEVLEQAPTYFLANIELDSLDELVLVEKKKASIKITYQDKKSEIYSIEKFIKLWTGVVVAIEKDETVEEVAPNPLASIGKWLLYITTIVFVGYGLYTNPGLFASSHFILSAIGLIISVFIIKHELGSQSAKANSFCNLSESTSCDAILNSKGATLFGSVKLSDLGLVAFASCCLCWGVFALIGISNFTVMSIVTLLAFPFTIYSLYYQFAVVKKWCPLCLGIVSVLLLQIVALVSFDFSLIGMNVGWNSVSVLLLSLLVTIGIWNFLKPLLEKQKTLDTLEVEHFKFKRNFSLFNALFKENALVTPLVAPGEITFGNENAPIELVVVTSPLCHFCKAAHKDLEKIQALGKDKVKVTFRFIVDTHDKEWILYKIVSQLLHIYHTQGQAACLLNLDTLYAEEESLERWMTEQNFQTKPSYDTIMELQKDWCANNDINFTPALYVNNREFPDEYDRSDLVYFLDDIIEQIETNTPSLGSMQTVAS